PLRLRGGDPAKLVMLRPAEVCRHRKMHDASGTLRDVVARYLVATVGLRLAEVLAPAQHEIVEQRLLARLAPRGVERRLAGLDHALREVPVAVAAEDEIAPAVRPASDDDDSGRA